MDLSAFLETFLEEADDLVDQWESVYLKIESGSSNVEYWNALFRVAHTFKGSSKAVGLNEFGDFIHKVEDLLTFMKNNPSKVTDRVLGALSDSFEIIREWMERTRNGEPSAPEYQANLITIKNLLSELSGTPPEDEQAIQEVVKPPMKPSGMSSVAKANTPTKRSAVLRINIEKIDKLMQLIGEISTQASIVFHHKRIGKLSSSKCMDSLELLEQNLPALRDLTLDLRMETLEKFFQRMQKIANDVARSLGKKINVVIEGKDIELDKTIVDKIVDPFVHIVRNAVDHGMEMPEERVKNTKSPIGTVLLRAVSNGNQIEISVKEDGKGMDHNKLMAKAKEKGIIEHTNLSRKEALQLILKPGFSTAEKITDVSGRGVGMDVVSSTLTLLGGSLEIDSTLGHGSTFTACLPASVAIIDSFVIENDSAYYVVPRMDVVEVLEMAGLKKTVINGKELVVQYREKIIPVLNLSDYISSSAQKMEARQAFLVSDGEKSLAIEVEQIAWQQEIVARKIQGSLGEMKGVSGYTILSDGEPSLILSLKEFVNDYFKKIAA